MIIKNIKIIQIKWRIFIDIPFIHIISIYILFRNQNNWREGTVSVLPYDGEKWHRGDWNWDNGPLREGRK